MIEVVATKWIIWAAAIILIGCKHDPAPTEKKASTEAPPAEVILMGPVTPRNVISVQPTVEGILDAWTIEAGASVYKDQLLARIRVPKLEEAAQQRQTELDQLQLRAQNLDGSRGAAKLEISRAEAEKARADGDLDRLKKTYDRYKALWDLGAIARLDFEKSEKEYKNAEAAARDAQKALETAQDHAKAIDKDGDALRQEIADKTKAVEQAKAVLSSGDLHSPADGIVVARSGDAGQPVDPSMKDLVQVATDLTELQVTLTPSASELARMRPGLAADVQFDNDYSGTIREIRGQQVIVDFSTSAPIVKIGGTAQVRIKF